MIQSARQRAAQIPDSIELSTVRCISWHGQWATIGYLGPRTTDPSF